MTNTGCRHRITLKSSVPASLWRWPGKKDILIHIDIKQKYGYQSPRNNQTEDRL